MKFKVTSITAAITPVKTISIAVASSSSKTVIPKAEESSEAMELLVLLG